MSQQPNITPASITPLLQRTVGALVAERPGRSRVFQSFQIDSRSQANRTLAEACAMKNIPASSVVEKLKVAEKRGSSRNPAKLPLHELAGYIVQKHHKFLRRELPRLHALAERVTRLHGAHTPSLLKIYDIYLSIEAELTSHMTTQEHVLFPAVVALSKNQPVSRSLDGPIAQMIHRHGAVGTGLKRLRDLSNGFVPPGSACNAYRTLFAGLNKLEADLHWHIHLENSVLFPGAKALAEKLNTPACSSTGKR